MNLLFLFLAAELLLGAAFAGITPSSHLKTKQRYAFVGGSLFAQTSPDASTLAPDSVPASDTTGAATPESNSAALPDSTSETAPPIENSESAPATNSDSTDQNSSPSENEPSSPTGNAESSNETPQTIGQPEAAPSPAETAPSPDNGEETSQQKIIFEENPPSETPQEIPTIVEPVAQETAPETVFSQEEISALTESGSLVNSDAINQNVVDRAAQEDQRLAEAQTPQEKTDLLLNNAENEVKEIETLTEINDLPDKGFLIGRLDEHIDETLNTLGGLNFSQGAPQQEELKNFAEKTDVVLRKEQLTVSEDLEQEFEITRGKTLLVQLR